MVEETSDSDRYCRFGHAKTEHEEYTFKMAKARTNNTHFIPTMKLKIKLQSIVTKSIKMVVDRSVNEKFKFKVI